MRTDVSRSILLVFSGPILILEIKKSENTSYFILPLHYIYLKHIDTSYFADCDYSVFIGTLCFREKLNQHKLNIIPAGLLDQKVYVMK